MFFVVGEFACCLAQNVTLICSHTISTLGRLAEVLMDVTYKPYWWTDVRAFRVEDNSSSPSIDTCSTFSRVCENVLYGIGCAAHDQLNVACEEGATSIAQFVGLCGCSDLNNAITSTATTRVLEYIIDGVLARDVALLYAYIVPSRSPGSHLVGSTNFKQLLSPERPLPGYTTSFG